MKKLWIFGDSYAVPFFDGNEVEIVHWSGPLTKKLKCDRIEFRAHNGTANEWIYYQFRQHLEHITEDDYVVVISTQFDRKWFFLENVGVSNLNVRHLDIGRLNKDQINAIDQYLLHLNNPLVGPLSFEMFCYSLHYISSIKKLNLLLVPGFEEKGFPLSGKYTVSGSLFDVCKNEIKGKDVKTWFNFIHNKHKGIDPRIGHISQNNHQILAEKIANTFLKNEVLNLEQGFEEEFLE